MRANGGRGIVLATAITAGLTGVAFAPAGAGEAVDTFAGSCSAQGTNKFDPPVTSTQQLLRIDYDGPGTCTGTLNGRRVTDAPVRWRATGRSDGSCLRARSLEANGGLTFADGTEIRFTFDFLYVASEGNQTWHGERSGRAPGRGSFRTARSAPPSEVAAKCNGEGHRELPLDLSFTTETPLVSERRGGDGLDRPARRGGESARLRLAVRPRRARAGRRTAFRFRVIRAGRGGLPVQGALVRFAGRRARTNHAGRTRIAVRFRGMGRRRARATLHGYRGARATVRVRRGPRR